VLVESVDWIQLISGLTLGLALAATCGLRAFLPLFAVGCLGATGQLELADAFAWLQRPVALVGLGVAVVFEIAGDKFPVVDHFLDSAAVFVKPVAAMVASASVMTDMDPMVTSIVGLLVGGTMAEGVHLVKAKVRLMSSALTATMANPFISVFEDILAVVSTILAFVAPLLILLLALVAGFIGFRWWFGRRA
jgi:hypothetical protein